MSDREICEIEWRCSNCLAPNRTELAAQSSKSWVCAKCCNSHPFHTESLNETGELRACPVCGCPDLYRQRDFNRRLGISIIVIGAILATYTHFISLVVCALIDLGIYYVIPEAVICYHCHAILRNFPGSEKVQPFDLNVSDKYIEVERKRGW